MRCFWLRFNHPMSFFSLALGELRIYLNRPLAEWSHGDAADPKKWPRWKRFHFAHNRLAIAWPSSGYRFWLYTRTRAWDIDLFIDRRPDWRKTPDLQPPPVTFAAFQEMNARRCREAFDDHLEKWEPEMWGLAIAGEAGELCNLLKKIRRGDFTLEQKREDVIREVADVIAYCDLLMSKLGASTGEAVLAKFDEVSERVGWKR